MASVQIGSGRRVRLHRAALGVGVLTGPSAWTLQLIGDWILGEVIACAPASMPAGSILGAQFNVVAAVLNGVLLALTVLSGALSYAELRGLHRRGGHRLPADPWAWLAVAGIMSSGLFAILIATSFVPIVLIGGCQ